MPGSDAIAAAAATTTLAIVARGGEAPRWLASLPLALRSGNSLRIVAADTGGGPPPEDAALRADLQWAECAIVAGDVGGIPALARRIRALDDAVQTAVVVADDERPALERALLFAPGVGELWLVTPPEVNAALVARAADVTRRRRQFGRTRERIASTPAAAAQGRPGGGGGGRAPASEAFLAGLLRVLPDPVFSVDERGIVLSANEAGTALVTAAGGALEETSVWRVLPPPGPPVAHSSAVAAEGTVTYATEVRARGGEDRTFEVRVTPARAGAMLAWAIVARDVTEHRRAQAQLEEQAAELEEQAAEMEAQQLELQERTEAAEEARQQADQANAAKSQFLATMSHELRTPLNAILGYAQLLDFGVKGVLNDEQRGYLARLRASGTHLLSLINDVLDLSKIEAGGMTVAAERHSSADVVQAAFTLSAPLAGPRGVELVLTCETAEAVFVGDADRVRQVLVNLISNAVKFTDAGGRVVVTCGRRDAPDPGARVSGQGPWAFVRVTDTGVGIAPEVQAAVFDPFYQVEGGRTRKAGGTGLGLAISRRLARLMGGDLTLESTPGAGSAFTLWLPAPARQEESEEQPLQRAERARRTSPQHRTAGLRELGLALRDEMEEVLEAFSARLRADEAFTSVRRTPQTELEDHGLAFISDLTQTLVIVDETGDASSDLYRDSEEIGRFVAERHGRQRWRIGWTEGQLAREYTLLLEELTTRLQRHDAAAPDDVALAVGVVRRLLAHARMAAVVGYRAAAAAAAADAEPHGRGAAGAPG